MPLSIEMKRKIEKLQTIDHNLLLNTHLCPPIEQGVATTRMLCNCCGRSILPSELYYSAWGFAKENNNIALYVRCTTCFEKVVTEMRLT
jgi:hypothetical protein